MSIRTGLSRLAGVTRDVIFALSSKARIDRWRDVRKVYLRSHESFNKQKLSRSDLFTSKFDPLKQVNRDRWTGRVFQKRTALFSFLGISFMAYGQKEATLLDSVKEILPTIQPTKEKKKCDELKPDDIELGPFIAHGCFGAVFQARPKTTQDYSLAVKVVFNRNAGSTTTEIMEKLGKEALVERGLFTRGNFRSILSHQNVIQVKSVFVHEAKRLNKLIIPDRIKPRISARSRTLFVVMERCDTTLHSFLRGDPIPLKMRTLLFAQLLEAIAYLNEKGIAHRDMKTDNILLKFVQGPCPRLVVTDFGLAYVSKLMLLHFSSDQVCRGGNRALMPPEIANAKSGPFSVLDYRKSDAWSTGAIGYEIFGCNNPFYSKKGFKLDSATYKEEDLPPTANVSPVISYVISNLLKTNPSERLSASFAATLVQLYLWDPVTWFESDSDEEASSNVVLECFMKLLFSRWHPLFSLVEKELIEIFLTRVTSSEIVASRQTIACILNSGNSSNASPS